MATSREVPSDGGGQLVDFFGAEQGSSIPGGVLVVEQGWVVGLPFVILRPTTDFQGLEVRGLIRQGSDLDSIRMRLPSDEIVVWVAVTFVRDHSFVLGN